MEPEQTDSTWEQLAPLLEEAMAHLSDTDRNAVVLRYFENRNLRDVGVALGTSEDTAQKRVTRGIHRLRAYFIKHGVVVPAIAISPDTNWVDVGFGPWTAFAVKSDGALWAWGRNAHVYTGVRDQALDAKPTRVGSSSDWRAISASAGWWWFQGLTKTDGSLWLMDASDGKPNGPRSPFKPVQFRRCEFQKDYVAYAAGDAHAPAPGVYAPIGVALTRDGEVWTWGSVLGEYVPAHSNLQSLARLAARLHWHVYWGESGPMIRDRPWLLPNLDPSDPSTR